MPWFVTYNHAEDYLRININTMEYEQDINRQLADMITGDRPQELIRLASEARVLMAYYRCAMLEVETRFRGLNEQFSLGNTRNPIESIKTRLKTIDSIKEKLERRGFPVTLESIEKNLTDVAGVRIICGFTDDIYLLADYLHLQDDIRVVSVKDYIKEPKESGYMSLHVIVEVPIFLCGEKKHIKVEVQLRTMVMDAWSNLEYRLRYKKSIDENTLALIAEDMNECARMSASLDVKLRHIRDIIDGN